MVQTRSHRQSLAGLGAAQFVLKKVEKVKIKANENTDYNNE